MNAVKRLTLPKKHDRSSVASQEELLDDVSPELVPIVTLLSSQSHRRYHEGIFMLYYDLNGDGKPAEREWREVYGILTGNQLGYWDAANLVAFKNNPEGLLEASAKPNYINFTDSIYNAMRTLPAAKQNLDNVIIVSTTLKNRYLLQFKSYRDLTCWYTALRLSNFEYNALQEAYTGALLSARGSRLSDVKTILAEKRFDHEDWVSIRYGSGMAWKRCYAVVEPSTTKRRLFTPGRVLFYENDQKKKRLLIAVVTNVTSVAAVYPQSHQLIDHSTMLKLEAYVNFKTPSFSPKKKNMEDFNNASLFLMPEQHSSVPGFDTLIRFLIPLLDSFGLYGRPKRLKADRVDPESLLFALPTLPRVHYLDVNDLSQLTNNSGFLSWDSSQWANAIKSLLKSKLDRGYEGCGSSRGVAGAISSLSSPTGSSFESSSSSKKSRDPSSTLYKENPSSRSLPPPPAEERNIKKKPVPIEKSDPVPDVATTSSRAPPPAPLDGLSIPANDPHRSVQLADIYHKYSKIQSPSDQFHDRDILRNGSEEQLLEDELPESFRQVNLGLEPGMYPQNDDNLFSDDDDDDDAPSTLVPPDLRSQANSSSSSVRSPGTQYHQLNQEITKTLDLDQNLDETIPRKVNLAKSSPSYNLSDAIDDRKQLDGQKYQRDQYKAQKYPQNDSQYVSQYESQYAYDPNAQKSLPRTKYEEPQYRADKESQYQKSYKEPKEQKSKQNPYERKLQKSHYPEYEQNQSQPSQYHQPHQPQQPQYQQHHQYQQSEPEYSQSQYQPQYSRSEQQGYNSNGPVPHYSSTVAPSGYQQKVPEFQKVNVMPYPPPKSQPQYQPQQYQAAPQQQSYPQSGQFGYTGKVQPPGRRKPAPGALGPMPRPMPGAMPGPVIPPGTGAKPVPVAGAKPVPVAGAKPVPVAGAKPVPVAGAKPGPVAGAKPSHGAGTMPIPGPSGMPRPMGPMPMGRGDPSSLRLYEPSQNPHVYYQTGVPPSINLSGPPPGVKEYDYSKSRNVQRY